ncbi:MAG: helix-turn-helix transcriptional regulator [Bacilli bacterium]|nr:helix-turn-helix transcriptional regulator [Bacilli bacterium]
MHNKLKELRMKNHYTTKDMGKKLKISSPFYSQIENERRNLTYEMAVKIAKVFKMKPDKLFYDEYKNRVD